jgi:3-oxosteroid 1-dehydrogenase
MMRDGVPDSIAAAQEYLAAVIGDPGNLSSAKRRDAFLREGPKLVEFLESEGIAFRRCRDYPDYYDELPGSNSRGRSLEVDLFDGRALGDWAERMNRFAPSAFPARCSEFASLSLAKQTWRGRMTAVRLAYRLLRQRMSRAPLFGQGAALQGRLLHALLRHAVPVWLEAPVIGFALESNRVAGVKVRREGRTLSIQATSGVLINAGGFAQNLAMRQKYLPSTQFTKYSLSNEGDTGEVLNLAMELGAAVDFMDEAIWGTMSITPDGVPSNHTVDITKPHSLLVDSTAQRFVNEAMSYMEIGQTLYKRHQHVGAIPCWAIIDSRHRKSYPWGAAAPGITPTSWITKGYLKKAGTIGDLAKQCGLNAEALCKTVARFNDFARRGVDEDFHRGARRYDCYYADPSNRPNPTLGPVDRPPFYAVAVYPGDVGTVGGVVTDEYARVLRLDGSVIPGLYATGNSAASVMGRKYPGAGASIANSLVFGYVAAKHALGVGTLPE